MNSCDRLEAVKCGSLSLWDERMLSGAPISPKSAIVFVINYLLKPRSYFDIKPSALLL